MRTAKQHERGVPGDSNYIAESRETTRRKVRGDSNYIAEMKNEETTKITIYWQGKL